MKHERTITLDDPIFALVDTTDGGSIRSSIVSEFVSQVKLDESEIVKLVLCGQEREVLSREQLRRFKRLLKIYKATLSLFENDSIQATDFMLRPCHALGQVAPLKCVVRGFDTENVLRLIGRLEHGIPN